MFYTQPGDSNKNTFECREVKEGLILDYVLNAVPEWLTYFQSTKLLQMDCDLSKYLPNLREKNYPVFGQILRGTFGLSTLFIALQKLWSTLRWSKQLKLMQQIISLGLRTLLVLL